MRLSSIDQLRTELAALRQFIVAGLGYDEFEIIELDEAKSRGYPLTDECLTEYSAFYLPFVKVAVVDLGKVRDAFGSKNLERMVMHEFAHYLIHRYVDADRALSSFKDALCSVSVSVREIDGLNWDHVLVEENHPLCNTALESLTDIVAYRLLTWLEQNRVRLLLAQDWLPPDHPEMLGSVGNAMLNKLILEPTDMVLSKVAEHCAAFNNRAQPGD